MNGVIYARFSAGPNQTYKSIEGQMRDCKAYAEQKGIKIIDTYIDEHISGKDFDGRAAFQKLMRDAQKKMFDCVIVWKIDRLGRNREELAIAKARLKRYGVHVHYAMEHIPEGPEGIILESLMEGLAEYYSAELAQKVSRGMRESILSGKMINGNQCFGYLVVDRHYVPDPERAYLVQEIFERYVSGETAAKICRDFSLRGIKTTAGEDLKPKAVYKILRNIKYTGLYVYGEISIPDFHERLISDDLFESAQLRLKRNAKGKSKRVRKDMVEYLLTGKLYCGKCKNRMIGESGHGRHGEVHHYYKCSGRKNKNIDCDTDTFRKDDLEKMIIQITQKDILTGDMIEYLVSRVLAMQAEEAEDPVIRSMKKALNDTRRKIGNIMNAIECGILTPTTKERLMNLESEESRLTAEITRQQMKKTSYTADEIRFYLESFRDGDADNADFARHLIEVFVNSIYVYDDYLVMFYNFNGGGGGEERYDFAEIADEAINRQKNSEETCSVNVSSAGREETLSEPAVIAFVTLHSFGVIIKRYLMLNRHSYF